MTKTANIKIAKPKQISEIVLDRLRLDIIRNQFSLGEKVSESLLSEMYGVTKAPIRAAYVRLELEGLLEVRPQAGTFVFHPKPIELKALCELRGALELEASRLAMQRDPAGLAKAFSNCVREMEEAIESRSLNRYQELDSRLHLTVIAHSSSPLLEQSYVRQVDGRFSALRYRFSQKHSHNEASLAEHWLMRDAIVNNDLASLLELTRSHIYNTEQYYSNLQI